MNHRLLVLSWLSVVLFLVILPIALTADVDHGKVLIDWLRSKGGFVHEHYEIRRENPQDRTSRLGVFSKGKIAAKELILQLPRHAILGGISPEVGDTVEAYSEEDGDWFDGTLMGISDNRYHVRFSEDGIEASLLPYHVARKMYGDVQCECDTAYHLADEMKKGDDSKFSAYVNYLLEQPHGQIPVAWSDAGKQLYLALLGSEGNSHLPPENPFMWEWEEECRGNPEDTFSFQAAMLVVMRSWDDLLLPVYDMMSHRNGKWLNTDSNHVHVDEKVEVRAIRDIEAGEELYTSYNMCADCGLRANEYGAPEIFRDYGFVEQFPQRWIFHEVGLAIDIDESPDGKLDVKVLSGPPKPHQIEYLEYHRGRLASFESKQLEEAKTNVPKNEYDMIVDYHQAFVRAIEMSLEKGTDTPKNDEL